MAGGFAGETYRTFKEERTPVLPELFPDTGEEEALPNSFEEASITPDQGQMAGEDDGDQYPPPSSPVPSVCLSPRTAIYPELLPVFGRGCWLSRCCAVAAVCFWELTLCWGHGLKSPPHPRPGGCLGSDEGPRW